MQQLIINDWSAGWIPQESPTNGRKNGLLKMDSLELDINGEVTLTGGNKNIFDYNYPADAHTLYSKFIDGIQRRYLALTNGAVYRDINSIISAGSLTRAAFGAAYGFIYIFSGNKRRKDDGSITSVIGITESNAPVIGAVVNTGVTQVGFVSGGAVAGPARYDGIIPWSTSGIGTLAEFTILYDAAGYYIAIEPTVAGMNYALGDTLTFLGTQLGGLSPANDLIVQVLNVNGKLNGTYEYAQQYVVNHGNGYVAKSKLSPLSATLNVINGSIKVITDITNIPSGDSQSWVYRRGGNLEQFYRCKLLTNTGVTLTFVDNVSDDELLQLNITSNIFLEPTNVTGIPDDILEVVGPINGRMLLFTASTIHFSEPNNPDAYDTRYSINFAGNQFTGSELFLWSKQVGDQVIMIGTNKCVYTLSGTFIALPDGFLDVYLRPLNTKYPPLSRDADIFNNAVVYCSDIGWIIMHLDGNIEPLCPPNTDVLYRGQSILDYGGVPIYIYPAIDAGGVELRYSCAVARNKLWCKVPEIVANDVNIPFTYRLEVYDFVRKYWRVVRDAPKLLYAQEDGAVMGFFSDVQRNIREIDNQFTKLNYNASSQSISLLTPFYDQGFPFNRKESYTSKLRIYTGGSDLTYKIYINSNLNAAIALGIINTSSLDDFNKDLNALVGIAKNWALELTGAVNDFRLASIEIDYEPYPPQQTFYNGLIPNRQGRFNKSKFLVWPIVIDTLGTNVTFTPYIDGIAKTSQIINTTGKKTSFYYALEDLSGIDLTFKLSGNLFELWEVGPPELVNILPIAKKYDQLGPEELFKYGKVKSIFVRLLALGTSVPYTLYFQDGIQQTGNLSVTPDVEDTYQIDIPKTRSGQVIRLTLGPTDFIFYRYYIRLQVAISGKDTENTYVVLPAQ